MPKRKVRRTTNFSPNLNLASANDRLLFLEWMVVFSIPLLMIGAIRFIAIFYTFAATLVLVGSYLIVAIVDANKGHPSLHLVATVKYIVIATALTVVIYYAP